jgi:hypothetical protein
MLRTMYKNATVKKYAIDAHSEHIRSDLLLDRANVISWQPYWMHSCHSTLCVARDPTSDPTLYTRGLCCIE